MHHGFLTYKGICDAIPGKVKLKNTGWGNQEHNNFKFFFLLSPVTIILKEPLISVIMASLNEKNNNKKTDTLCWVIFCVKVHYRELTL